MSQSGVDYAWGIPGGKNIRALGYNFVCRYLSFNSEKNLSPAEVTDLKANKLGIVLVWESTERRALDGFDAGVIDVSEALELANSLGAPDAAPIYFACDYDFSYIQQQKVNDYFAGIASVIPVEKIGIYAGYDVISRALNANIAKYAWQTSAWSRGKWDARIHIKQIRYGILIRGVACDINESCQDDFGQW